MHLLPPLSWQWIYFPLSWYKSLLHINSMILDFPGGHPLWLFLAKDFDPHMELLWNQLLSLCLQLHCFFFLIPNLLFLSYSFYLHLLFFFLFFLLLFFLFISLPSCFLFCLFFFLFLPPWLPLLQSPLPSTFLRTSCHLNFPCSPINFKVVVS